MQIISAQKAHPAFLTFSPSFFSEKSSSSLRIEVNGKSSLAREVSLSVLQSQSISTSPAAYLSVISHELKTPLNAIIGFSELLKHGKNSVAESEDYINEILQAANEMNELVDDLLDVSAVNSGNFSVEMNNYVQVREVVRRSIKLNYGYATNGNITICSEVFDDVSLIKLDEKRLKQILTNLVSNAVKYSPKNSKIKITAENISENQDKLFLQITITDQGFGMTEEQVETAFQKYKTIQNPNSGKVDSFGLGLPIVKQLTESMNGTIEVKSEVNKGTEVKLKFPYLM